MSIGFIFWLLWLLGLIFGVLGSQPVTIGGRTFPGWPQSVLLWILLGLLGWGIFGFIIKG